MPICELCGRSNVEDHWGSVRIDLTEQHLCINFSSIATLKLRAGRDRHDARGYTERRGDDVAVRGGRALREFGLAGLRAGSGVARLACVAARLRGTSRLASRAARPAADNKTVQATAVTSARRLMAAT